MTDPLRHEPELPEVVAKTEEVIATESEMRRALVGGMDPVDAYHRYGKF